MDYVPDSAEAARAFHEAEDIAGRAQQQLSSAHVLLALFTFPNRAQALLAERGVNEDVILDQIRAIEDEPRGATARVRDRARELARSSASREVDCLHLLIAITRMRDAFAYRILERTGTSLTALRNIAVSYVTGNMPRRFRAIRPEPAPSASPLGIRHSRPPPAQVVEREPEPMPEAASETETDEFDAVADAIATASEPASPALAPRIVSPRAQPIPPKPAASRSLLEELAPTLALCAVDLTEKARQNALDQAICRERELEALIDILGKRRANNPVLVGPPGVGKTAIVEGLAVKIARRSSEVGHLCDRVIAALDTGALVAGTSLRGAFSERLGAIKDEVARTGGRIIVFIDELHTLIGAGASGEGAQDAANELKAALARGEFPCIGATTYEEFRKHIEKDPALERRFTPIHVEEPTPDEAILILEGAISPYAQHHEVAYTLEAVHAAVHLSHRFITDRRLPDKAFAALDLAGSRARRRGSQVVDRMDLARVVCEWSGVPLERLADTDADRFGRAEEIIGQKLIGHPEVVAASARAIRRGFAGFSAQRPMASLLLLGPTGVGKTELAKILAEFLYGRREAMVRVDMSELSEPHAVARLIGAQPGYIGYEEGGQLTEAVRRRPFQVVLFDEVEKAHREVLNLLLQILDEGRLTDAHGRRVSFANTVVVLTSNLGADLGAHPGRAIGFAGSDVTAEQARYNEAVLEAARKTLAPELWARLDERLVFEPLAREDLKRIATLQLEQSSRTLFGEREVSLAWDDVVLDFLLDHGGFSPETGARGMRQTIQRFIEGPIADQILAGTLGSGAVTRISVGGDGSLRLTCEQPVASR